MSDFYYTNGELYHYGIPGMKWGVYRNIRVLANNRRNKKVAELRSQRNLKKIDKAQFKKGVKEANASKKQEMKNLKSQVKNTKTKEEFKSVKTDIKNQTIKEVPSSTFKKGLRTVNNVLHNVAIADAAITAVGSLATPLGPAIAGVSAASIAIAKGEQYLINYGLDKLS